MIENIVDDAFDTFRNQRVRAVRATEGRFPERYLCPVCHSEVFYAAGKQVPHFRHFPGAEDDECERRAKNFGREVPLAAHEYEHLDAVLVAKHSLTGKEPTVVFAVRFRPAYQVGYATFVEGDRSTPYTVHPNRTHQYFRVTSVENNYLIRTQPRGKSHESHLIEGFSERPALFRANEGEAVRIPNHRVLKPGTYIVVSTKSKHNFHRLAQPKIIKTLGGLYAISIQIPADLPLEVRRNLESALDFEIATKVAVYGFLTPATAYELAPDCWEISKDAPLAIRVRLPQQFAGFPTNILIQERRGSILTSRHLPLTVGTSTFVIQAPEARQRPDIIRIGFLNPVRFLFEIYFSSNVITPQSANIVFKFATPSNKRTRLTWTAHELPKFLLDSVDGRAELTSVNIPSAIKPTLSDSSGRHVTVNEGSVKEAIISFLASSTFPCILSTPGYPDIVLKRESQPSRYLKEVLRLSERKPRSRKAIRMLRALHFRKVSSYSLHSVGL